MPAMRIPGEKSMRRGARWLGSRLRPGGLVLLYHRIADSEGENTDPFSLCVSRRNFADHLESLHRFATVVSLEEMWMTAAQGRLPPRSVALSFDDGYADNLANAKPLLEKYEVPATVFVVAGCLGATFWWDRLTDALLGPTRLPDHLRLTVAGRTHEWRLASGDPRQRRRLLRQLFRTVRDLRESERQQTLEAVASWSGDTLAATPHRRPLTREELVELAEGGAIEVGAHGMTHHPLSTLSPVEQHSEISGSKGALEEILQRPVTSFSYPFGLARDYTSESVALVASCGFDRAYTNICDVVRPTSDRYQLPRYWVRDWEGERFRRHLDRWLGT